MKRYLVLVSLFLLFGVVTASAQTTYTLTTTPTFVINDGRAEVMGNVRITGTNAGPTIFSTINVLYVNVSCDNDVPSGVSLNVAAPFVIGVNVTNLTVTNTSAGCTVSYTVAGGLVTVAGASFIEVRGVRGRVDMSAVGFTTGQNIFASINATPSNSSVFTVPSQGIVATTNPGLIATITATGSVLQCLLAGTNPTLQIKEGFNGAFVQHVTSAALTGPPVAGGAGNGRPVFGGTNNTEIQIIIAGLPSGVTLTWPAVVADSALPLTAFAGANTAGSGVQLERMSTATATTQVYEFVAGDQGLADIRQNVFNITPLLTATATAAFGTATAQAQLWPGLITGDATAITDAPAAVAAPRPRFNDPLQPAPPAAFATSAPCRTNLLFPWVANIVGYDTGIAIANTSKDPFGAVGAVNQNGKCRLYGFPQATPYNTSATPAASFFHDSPIVKSGDTLTFVAGDTDATNPSGAAFNAFTGYIIAVCDFQYGHGFAFITHNLGSTDGSDLSQGYLALLIPDPNVVAGGRQARSGAGSVGAGGVIVAGAGAVGAVAPVAQAGEGLIY